jgi:hypothetical protein
MTMAILRTTAWVNTLLILAVMGFWGSESHAQVNRQELEEQYKRWLPCDVVWGVSAGYSAGPNFTAKVLFRYAPVSSAKVVLAREGVQRGDRDWIVVATSQTNALGIAQFSAIPSGKYRIYLDEELLSPGSEEIHIDAKSKVKTEVNFEWPGKFTAARNLRGVFLASDEWEETALPLPYVSVQLFDLRKASLIASTNTDREGRYEFPSFGDGLYVVRLNEDQYADAEHHDFAIDVKSDAVDEVPAMKIVRRGCDPGLFSLDGVKQ